MTRVLISILNWNSSDKTSECIQSLMHLQVDEQLSVDIRVRDNGSALDQLAKLKVLEQSYPSVSFDFSTQNTGFTGGQNHNIQYALDQAYDYIWLLNNDTVVYPDALGLLVQEMESDPKCGASSPIILRLGQPEIVDFCGACHEWSNIDTLRPNSLAEAPKFLETHAKTVWAVGTALLLSCAAVREIGMLNSDYFAYYEDDDFGARLVTNGWHTRIVLEAKVEHACFEGDMFQRQPYFFYLLTRNAVFFALTHVPAAYRRFLRVRYVTRSFHLAEKLYGLGHAAKAQACLLGLSDGLFGRGGPPKLGRTLPFWVAVLRPLLRWWNTR
ncbi:MAG: glycosyltransferase family 2 protein [Rhodoferax sp.]|uniref:glycosyltransferase n=1 Tax=Rhodoferax sp. TaxID=50421 RepID=UPI00260E1879|nr:glycosyltransferase family 2 protein [Rhodoferax sp.]MDD2881493.1 glycosyltransferase family 2 protein [Rhodoferax sp.]